MAGNTYPRCHTMRLNPKATGWQTKLLNHTVIDKTAIDFPSKFCILRKGLCYCYVLLTLRKPFTYFTQCRQLSLVKKFISAYL